MTSAFTGCDAFLSEGLGIADRYIGPSWVLERIGPTAYRLALPPSLADVHNVFHVSQLKERLGREQAVTPELPLPEGKVIMAPEVDRRMVKRRNVAVPQVLIKWANQDVEEATWEDSETVAKGYPQFILGDKENSKGGRVSVINHGELGVTVRNFDFELVRGGRRKG